MLNQNLGGFKIYSTVSQLGLNSADIVSLEQVIAAMPDFSLLLCSADKQLPNIVFPTAFGTLEIKRIDINRVSLKYYVSGQTISGRTLTGSFHGASGFSGWTDLLTPTNYQDIMGAYFNNTPEEVLVASGTPTKLAQINIATPGAYIIQGSVYFKPCAGGIRRVSIRPEITSGNTRGDTASTETATAQPVMVQAHRIGILSSPDTYYCVAWQDSGSSVECLGQIRALRVG